MGESDECSGEPLVRVDAGERAVLDEVGDTAQMSSPSSDPAKSAFLRFKAIGQMEFSTVLVSTRPSSRKWIGPFQRPRGCRIASASLLFALTCRSRASG